MCFATLATIKRYLPTLILVLVSLSLAACHFVTVPMMPGMVLNGSGKCLIVAKPNVAAVVAVNEISTTPVGRGLSVDSAIEDAYHDCERRSLDCRDMEIHSPVVRVVFSESVSNGVSEDVEDSSFGPIEVETHYHQTVGEEEIGVSASLDGAP